MEQGIVKISLVERNTV